MSLLHDLVKLILEYLLLELFIAYLGLNKEFHHFHEYRFSFIQLFLVFSELWELTLHYWYPQIVEVFVHDAFGCCEVFSFEFCELPDDLVALLGGFNDGLLHVLFSIKIRIFIFDLLLES